MTVIQIIVSGVGLEESDIYNLSLQIEGKPGTALKDVHVKSSLTVAEVRDTVRERRRSTLMLIRVPTAKNGSTSSSQDENKRNSLPVSLARKQSLTDVFRSSSEDSGSLTSSGHSQAAKRARKIAELKIKFFSAVTSGNMEKVQSLISQVWFLVI